MVGSLHAMLASREVPRGAEQLLLPSPSAMLVFQLTSVSLLVFCNYFKRMPSVRLLHMDYFSYHKLVCLSKQEKKVKMILSGILILGLPRAVNPASLITVPTFR